jgi:hypothetical protein
MVMVTHTIQLRRFAAVIAGAKSKTSRYIATDSIACQKAREPT